MLRSEQTCFHMDEVNWVPRSDVSVCGTPKRAIHVEQKASAQALAVMEVSGVASAQRVVRSIMVRMWVKPCDEGSGPTMSMWMWEKRREGMGMATGGGVMCLWVFDFWHGTHCCAQRLTSLAMPCQMNLDEMRRRVARMPGWPSACRWSNT